MASLVFRNGPYAGKSLQIPPGKSITLGRNRDIELPLPDLKLSRRHCQIEAGMAGFILRDMGSTNGTYLNGQRVSGEVSLRNFDRILIGDTEIEFQSPEEMGELQTRVGEPEPQKLSQVAPVSNALEPITGATGVSQPSAAGILADIPIPVPMPGSAGSIPVPIAAPDPSIMQELSAALKEMVLPLPAEPGSTPVAVQEKPQLYFCDKCDGSIPAVDLDLGMAKEISGRLYCKECLARGVSIGPESAPSGADAIFTDMAPARVPATGESVAANVDAQVDMDEILKGLEVEEVIADEGPVRAPKVVISKELDELKQNVASGITGGPTRRMRPLMPDGTARPATAPAMKPAKDISASDVQNVQDLLGDDFEELEEIGDPLPELPKAKPKPVPPKPAPKPPADDEDLIEIGSSDPA